jgi:hypothetical protein
MIKDASVSSVNKIIIIIIIVALQSFVKPWPLFQFFDPVHSW